ncbi:hypothetical protein OROGR_016080 [Orobanche gracilis]
MYAETALIFPYFPQEIQQFHDFCSSEKSNASVGIIPCSSLIQTSPTISDYNLGEEGDLFKAPEPVIQEPFMGLDPLTAVILMISSGEEVISAQSLAFSDVESGQLFSEVFYECRKDLLAKEGKETPLSEVLDIKIPMLETDEKIDVDDETLLVEGSFTKSASSRCLRSMDSVHEAPQRVVRFLNFPVSEFGGVYGMRRAFSEGDIKTLGNGDVNLIQSATGLPKAITSRISEERKEKLSRYWNKKSKRNFGRKIKYACRKALADSQPRIRGRFARTEEK